MGLIGRRGTGGVIFIARSIVNKTSDEKQTSHEMDQAVDA